MASRPFAVPQGYSDRMKDDHFLNGAPPRVYGVLLDSNAAQVLQQSLSGRVAAGAFDVLQAEQGVQAIDPTGKEGGILASLSRAMQNMTDERKKVEEYADQLRAGRVVVSVDLPDEERDTIEAVGQAFRQAGAVVINYFGTLLNENLDHGSPDYKYGN